MEHFYRRLLPHWEKEGAWYFLTFRLRGSIPKAAFDKWQAEAEERRQRLTRRHGRLGSKQERAIAFDIMRKSEHYLDSQIHIRYLEQPVAAEAFIANLERGTEDLYRFGPWIVMPNHVHLILTAKPDANGKPVRLARILQHLKGASAIQINRTLNRSGKLWQREYFDRLIRNMAEFRRKARYIEYNPVKARLCGKPEDWPWSSASRRLDGYELPE